jgi:hypothetical protein
MCETGRRAPHSECYFRKSGLTNRLCSPYVLMAVEVLMDGGIDLLESDRGAGRNECDEIEITPEMIEAGRDAYSGYFADLRGPDSREVSRKMVSEVYLAMMKAGAKKKRAA